MNKPNNSNNSITKTFAQSTLKPHIRKWRVQTYYMNANSHVTSVWQCYGFNITGYGQTPERAYEDWAKNRRAFSAYLRLTNPMIKRTPPMKLHPRAETMCSVFDRYCDEQINKPNSEEHERLLWNRAHGRAIIQAAEWTKEAHPTSAPEKLTISDLTMQSAIDFIKEDIALELKERAEEQAKSQPAKSQPMPPPAPAQPPQPIPLAGVNDFSQIVGRSTRNGTFGKVANVPTELTTTITTTNTPSKRWLPDPLTALQSYEDIDAKMLKQMHDHMLQMAAYTNPQEPATPELQHLQAVWLGENSPTRSDDARKDPRQRRLSELRVQAMRAMGKYLALLEIDAEWKDNNNSWSDEEASSNIDSYDIKSDFDGSTGDEDLYDDIAKQKREFYPPFRNDYGPPDIE